MKWDDMMARKKKVVIVDQELTTTVLAKKKKKKGSVIWILFIFIIFIGVVIYLPDIAVYVEDYLNPQVDVPNTPSNPNGNNPDDSDDSSDIKVNEYQLVDGLTIDVDGIITLSNIAIANNQISFSINNISNQMLDLAEYNYFMNLYNANNTLVQRVMVSDEVIPNGGRTDLTYDIVDSNISSISFAEVNEEDYPAHVVQADESGNATLSCVRNYETVNYLLTDNKVYSIQDVFIVPVTDVNYNTLYSSYQALAATYNTIGGINSNVTVVNNALNFTTNINLDTVNANSFNSKIYYPKNTDAKIMNFELEAQGYTCND